MRRLVLAILAVTGVFFAIGVTPASAQDILGLSLRPTDQMPGGTPAGTVDIVSDTGGQYKVSVDLSAAADNLKLESFPGSEAFVVWTVDSNGVRHNIGALDKDLVLKDAPVGFPVARIYVTAEAAADAASPAGKPLFAATLRNVQEVEATATTAAAAGASAAATAAPTAAAKPEEKPKVLPTTGDTLPDVLVLAAIAIGLLVVGLRLRAVRF